MNAKNECAYYKSPIGNLEIKALDEKVSEINFVEAMGEENFQSDVLKAALIQIDEYFRGKRKQFHLRLFIDGTEFQKKVWNELTRISYGEVVSYGEVAKAIGNKNASRAVGGANNKNKIPIIIPCHRVIGSDGRLIGYDGGIWRKKWLLEHERKFK
ncbi:methylated-DNA-[protein]-cysteine S-methyltransferase [Clostridium acetobutylicum]|uniref:Methylated-DNA--protein-cysteine methyltransferase n=1 Tax=Clostridium acetobutylicum (strain ATCC 824 / DSM 792 / JCM 1419 / IAM 19013 / LMG 5710 / NBRC 13948 / NRRL B-527 / VKM B-1787 / 2291 / W) TaxID=272562 RepID=Q97E55_CLOAB|nr:MULTISPECIES: methylated-DNA--[protein]-cysteine S-methyltransferase [Clostridium]AAK81195.1 Methylated DNA-protein cysteine methyltransferase [Clostridium acetobutylicum ATCC 824]ADZ22300.1 Methylated DNA-protein cysteine methyltransferase [Clostridium acetobutylicum EA 2018]AEI33679.1 methylated DNA-protein cysteine methyltransferase [Clostridium acetobutylicum DSM 1731]AWV81135.1 methylated-DNA--[protein]-cysteine S-methyltransferase [Clostridium acetobutylicum]MBC2395662.1 methylated-DN